MGGWFSSSTEESSPELCTQLICGYIQQVYEAILVSASGRYNGDLFGDINEIVSIKPLPHSLQRIPLRTQRDIAAQESVQIKRYHGVLSKFINRNQVAQANFFDVQQNLDTYGSNKDKVWDYILNVVFGNFGDECEVSIALYNKRGQPWISINESQIAPLNHSQTKNTLLKLISGPVRNCPIVVLAVGFQFEADNPEDWHQNFIIIEREDQIKRFNLYNYEPHGNPYPIVNQFTTFLGQTLSDAFKPYSYEVWENVLCPIGLQDFTRSVDIGYCHLFSIFVSLNIMMVYSLYLKNQRSKPPPIYNWGGCIETFYVNLFSYGERSCSPERVGKWNKKGALTFYNFMLNFTNLLTRSFVIHYNEEVQKRTREELKEGTFEFTAPEDVDPGLVRYREEQERKVARRRRPVSSEDMASLSPDDPYLEKELRAGIFHPTYAEVKRRRRKSSSRRKRQRKPRSPRRISSRSPLKSPRHSYRRRSSKSPSRRRSRSRSRSRGRRSS